MSTPGESEPHQRLLTLADRVLTLGSLGALFLTGFGIYGLTTTRWPGFLFMSVTCLGLALGFHYAVRRATAEARIGIMLATIATATVLYAAEVAATLSARSIAEAPPSGPGGDTRSMREVVLDLRAEGELVEPLVAPYEFVNNGGHETLGVLPLSGVSSAETVFCNETGRWLTYTSDEHGFNNPPGLWTETEVLVIGDSFAQGMCVERDESIAGQLRLTWPRTLTLAFGGNGPLLTLATLREYGEQLRPPWVVWVHYSGNDLDNLYVESTAPDLLQYLTDGHNQDLANRRQSVDSALRTWVSYQYQAETGQPNKRSTPGIAELLRFAKMSSLRSLLGLTRRVPYDLALYEDILREADELVAGWGGQVVFALLPSYNQLAGAKRTRGKPTEVIQLAEGLSWPIVDARLLLETEDLNPLPFFAGSRRRPGHYSPLAYRRVAEAVRDTIQAAFDTAPP